jgi:potassium/hydrogen antiporter
MEILAIVFGAGLVSQLVADALRLPRMVVLLAAGILLGPDVFGAIDVPLDSIGVQLLLSLGVSFILFYGGLGLSLAVLSRVGIGLGLLAVPGVVLTAVVTGGAAALAFDLPFEAGLLIGAVVAPTDPAILIPLFERLRVRTKVVQTVVAESALNDPTGAVLALAVAAFIVEGGGSLTEPFYDFVVDIGISTAIGLGFGFVLATALSSRRIGFWRESPELAAAAVVAASYVSIDFAGGSGYLGAFIAGVVAGNAGAFGLKSPPRREIDLAAFVQVVTDIVVILVFVILGANLPLETMADNVLPALAVLAALLFVARPLTVLSCLLPDRRGAWTREETAFIAWTRETGVVPAAVAGLLIAEGIEYDDELITVVAFAIVVTLVFQATTKSWLARRLGLLEEAEG